MYFFFLPTLEWLVSPGLGEGELEFVEVGVPDKLVAMWSSFSDGDVANNAISAKRACTINIYTNFILMLE